MKLADVFQNGQLKNANTQSAGSTNVGNAGQSSLAAKQMQALTPGQTLQGEVISRDGNQVQIKVADDFILEAKVDANVHLEVGKTMTFEVRGNGQTLQLSPLFANTATQANALKALEMASLPVTQDTVAMTGLMMEAGLSIDRNSLQQMFREVNSFPDSNVSDVVDLHRLGMPVNEENLAQVSSYKNLTHQLVDGMHTIQGSLSDTMGNMVAEGNIEGAARMFQDLLDLIQNGMAEGNPKIDSQSQNAQQAVLSEDGEGVLGQGQESAQKTVIVSANELAAMNQQDALDDAVNQIKAGAEKDFLQMLKDAMQTEGTKEGGVVPTENALGNARVANAAVSLQEAVNQLLHSSQGAKYNELLQQLSQTLQTGSVWDQAKALQQLLAQGLQNGDKELLKALVGNQGAQKILSEGLSKLWTITPEEVGDFGKVEELYTRLNRQLKDLSQILEQNGQTQSTAFKAVSNMTQNVDFLQQLNQAYTYVQLPLQLQGGEAHGDLYVYTNKRNLSAKDGQISALLHLDMEHLGPVDVYVAMQAERVNTKFYVRDDEMLDFLEQHMDLLTKRLQKRGYQCDFAMQVRGDESKKSGLAGLLEQEQAQPIAQYAFDVRA